MYALFQPTKQITTLQAGLVCRDVRIETCDAVPGFTRFNILGCQLSLSPMLSPHQKWSLLPGGVGISINHLWSNGASKPSLRSKSPSQICHRTTSARAALVPLGVTRVHSTMASGSGSPEATPWRKRQGMGAGWDGQAEEERV